MNKKRVLIIEDEKDLVDTLKFRLNANGYDTLVAYDGRSGFEMAKTEKPDIVILDLMLPKMDGYKICGLLKKDSRYSQIPIIMFTARAQAEDVKLGLEMGADAYITKPFEPKILMDKISELLEKR